MNGYSKGFIISIRETKQKPILGNIEKLTCGLAVQDGSAGLHESEIQVD